MPGSGDAGGAAPTVRIFNVFHQKLFPELMRDVPAADRGSVVLYGVNETIAKELPAAEDPAFAGFPVVLEYRLPDYRPWLQARGYCQTSSLYHVFKNEMDAGLDYVGWSQYDMKYESDTISHVRDTVVAARAGAGAGGTVPVFYEYAHTIPQALSLGNSSAWQHVLDSYNRYFGTAWTWGAVCAHPRMAAFCPLVHTFVMPREMFRRMMSWMCDYLDSIQPGGGGTAGRYPSTLSQAEFAERVHGIFLSLECARPEVVPVRMRLYHQWPMYHDQCPFDGYKCRMDG